MKNNKQKNTLTAGTKNGNQQFPISNGMSKKNALQQHKDVIPAAISVKNVSKTFLVPHEKISTLRGAFTHIFKKKDHDVLHALKDISFDVKKGEFFGIVGRNGSGKSTLLKILAGVYSTETGSIEVNGAISPFLELGIGFNPELSGRDNIYLNATVLGLTEKQVDKKFNDIVAFSELERFVDQKLKNYSSGMQMRLAFSVAIHANRDILLMDEVLAVGDASFQEKCLLELRRLKRLGKTIVLVSHSEQNMRDFADRVLVLDQGNIQIIGPVEKALHAYNTILVSGREEENTSSTHKADKLLKNKIVSIRIENDRGLEASVFENGDTIHFILEYMIQDISKQLHIGFGIIEKTTNVWVCGNNTLYDKENLAWKKGENIVRLSFPENIFHKGDFTCVSSLFSGETDDLRVMYDSFDGRENHFYFRSIPKDKRNGIIKMPHTWLLK
jgi:ABC-type polysaccharide/polyol phosphate transport system ATPase subunit